MKKTYIKPMISFEQFTPNEYIAACWTGTCNISGNVYIDNNKNGVYDSGDSFSYHNTRCKHDFSITGVDNGIDDANDLQNAFVVEKHVLLPDEVTPVYNYDKVHAATIDSIQPHDRPNHS